MNHGPLQRLIACSGLACLLPVLGLLLQGSITVQTAATRALIIGAVVVTLDTIARSTLSGMLTRLETRSEVRDAADTSGTRSAPDHGMPSTTDTD